MMLKDQVAVITGGTRGIGKAIAMKYAREGAMIAVIATRDTEAARTSLEELQQISPSSRLYACDVKDASQVEAVTEEILADFGHVDILVTQELPGIIFFQGFR